MPFQPADFPEHLHAMRIFGVDYVYGDTASTGGKLWVVGHDPLLFDYFLPERWRRTPAKACLTALRSITPKPKTALNSSGKSLTWAIFPPPPNPTASAPAPTATTAPLRNSPTPSN